MVISVDGHPAVDLVLLGADPRRRSLPSKVDPRPGVRRLGATWRVGRIAAALPDLAHDLVADIDSDLLAVPALDVLNDRDMLLILRNSGTALRALHGYEMLAGALLTPTRRPAPPVPRWTRWRPPPGTGRRARRWSPGRRSC